MMTEVPKYPKPNYVDPPSRAGLLTGVETPFAILMTAAVIARFYCRGALRQVLTWDDWLILPAWACFIAIFGVSNYAVHELGTARHLWDVWPPTTKKALDVNLGFEICYPIGVALTKVSVCANYVRVFPLRRDNQIFCKVAIAFSVAWGIATLIPQVHQFAKCSTASGSSSGVKIHRQCINQRAFLLTTASLNTASDFVIFLWPIRFLWGMKLPRDKRLGLVGLFSFGLIVCIAGLVRMWYYSVYFKSKDFYWDGVWNYILVAIETNLGVACACLPCIKPVLVKLFPFAFNRTTLKSEETPDRRGRGGTHRHGTHHTAPSTKKSVPLFRHLSNLSLSRGTTLNSLDHSSHAITNKTDGERSGADRSEGETTILMDDFLVSGAAAAASADHHQHNYPHDEDHPSLFRHPTNPSDMSLQLAPSHDDILPERPARALMPDEDKGFCGGMDIVNASLREAWYQRAPKVVRYDV
ncbi:uncharacterized protein IWZ02DRAFT_228776 [Phyllosticta citriasiana]|uniref:uncharacterized protein n=1 Tax=Phyllosticta citriasiana TaxID=595635 RepID=UPI0030FD7A8E